MGRPTDEWAALLDGTTRNKNFSAIGIEREADYIALINKRLGNNND